MSFQDAVRLTSSDYRQTKALTWKEVCKTILDVQSIPRDNENTIIRYEMTMLRYEIVILRYETNILRYETTILRYETTTLRYENEHPWT